VPTARDRDALWAAAPETAAVLSAWAPPGARALWTECRDGEGLHTWPEHEVIEIADDGEVLWSALGWRGTVLLRLRTGVRGQLVDTPCPACGSPNPRLLLG
jgi:hypothetical protein